MSYRTQVKVYFQQDDTFVLYSFRGCVEIFHFPRNFFKMIIVQHSNLTNCRDQQYLNESNFITNHSNKIKLTGLSRTIITNQEVKEDVQIAEIQAKASNNIDSNKRDFFLKRFQCKQYRHLRIGNQNENESRLHDM